MPFDIDNPVTVGNPTKADEFDTVFDNTQYLFKRILDITPADDNDAIGDTVGHDHTGSGEGVLIETAAIADNAVTEDKIADTDLPEAARAYVSTEVNGVSTVWTEEYDPGSNMTTFDAGGGDIRARYTTPSAGLYYICAQAKHDDINALQVRNTTTVLLEAQNVYKAQLSGASVCGTLKLPSGYDLDFYYTHSAGGNFTVGSAYTFFEVRKIPCTTAY